MQGGLSVLVVDDTITYRTVVSAAVKPMDCVIETESAPSGEIALQKLAHKKFDLVLLDIEMPGIGGLETLAQIKRDYQDTDVVMVSGISEHGAIATIRSMQAGAFGFVRKPTGEDKAKNHEQLRTELGAMVLAIWEKRRPKHPVAPDTPNSHRGEHLPVPAVPTRTTPPPTQFSVLAIGVSTGGPKALAEVIPSLPADFPLPVVVVQHMPAPFTEALASDLDRKSPLEVREAAQDDVVRPGLVLIAPGSRHMVVREVGGQITIGINDGPKENSCRPAVDVLFRSIANTYGNKGVLAAIMTGMGSDGVRGVRALKRKGCYCLTQSEASCVVYGMPLAVDEAGLSDESVGLTELAGRLGELSQKGAGRV